ncbi:YceI family protein [Myroides sp. LJL119]
MKKTIFAILVAGMFAVSCGQNKTDKVESSTTEKTQEQTKQDLNYTLQWTAFKTPEKVGVNGSFTDIKLNGVNLEAPTLEQALQGATFVVVTKTVNTKDPARDQTLVANFFDKMTGNINGFFGDFKDGKVAVHLTMNGKTIEKQFDYTTIENGIQLTGSIDIISDFAAQGAFDALHEACKALHEGKTWSDVNIVVDITK